MDMLTRAIAIAAEAFKDRKDSGGKPYILHCLEVMNNVPDEDKVPAVLHDFIEDSFENTEDGIRLLRYKYFSEEDIKVIDLLTHRKEDDYNSVYIKKIATCPRAIRIKLRDLEHNSQITRLKGLTKKDFDRMEKYHIAYTYLSKI